MKKDDEAIEEKIIEGLSEIAFGKIKDPIKLLFLDSIDDRKLSRMKLANISEVKKPKGGGMEIKFFDRIKAMQCLYEYSGQGNCDTSFFDALEKSAGSESGEEDLPDM